MNFSEAKFNKLKAEITLKINTNEEPEVVELTEGDSVSIKVAPGNYGSAAEETVDGTVLGFTMRSTKVDTLNEGSFDGIYTTEHTGFFPQSGMMKALIEVRDIVVKIPNEDGEDQSKRIMVDRILSIDTGVVVDVTTPEELAEALTNLEDGETIRLDDSITYESALSINASDVTIDLGGNTLTMATGSAPRPISVQSGASLTLKNGTLSRDEAGSYGLVENYGELTLDNMTVSENGGDGGATFRNLSGGHLIVNGGTFTNLGSSANQIFRNHAGETDTYLEINDATLSSEANLEYCVVVRSGEAVMNNVTTNGTHGSIAIEGGKVTVNSGNYTSANYYGLYVSNAYAASDVEVNGGTFTGGPLGNSRDILAIAPDGDSQGSLQKGNVTVIINNADCPNKVELGKHENTKGYEWTFETKGGIYGTDPSNYVPAGYHVIEQDGRFKVVPND